MIPIDDEMNEWFEQNMGRVARVAVPRACRKVGIDYTWNEDGHIVVDHPVNLEYNEEFLEAFAEEEKKLYLSDVFEKMEAMNLVKRVGIDKDGEIMWEVTADLDDLE